MSKPRVDLAEESMNAELAKWKRKKSRVQSKQSVGVMRRLRAQSHEQECKTENNVVQRKAQKQKMRSRENIGERAMSVTKNREEYTAEKNSTQLSANESIVGQIASTHARTHTHAHTHTHKHTHTNTLTHPDPQGWL